MSENIEQNEILKREIDNLKQQVNDIDNTLYGVKGSLDEPWGIVHRVFLNTSFRINTNRLLWVVIALLSSIIVDRIFGIFE